MIELDTEDLLIYLAAAFLIATGLVSLNESLLSRPFLFGLVLVAVALFAYLAR
ncbi:MAG: hypothetical protein ABEH65_08290 [Halobacteriales archaeon]